MTAILQPLVPHVHGERNTVTRSWVGFLATWHWSGGWPGSGVAKAGQGAAGPPVGALRLQ